MSDQWKRGFLKRMGSSPSSMPAAQLITLGDNTSHRRTVSLIGSPQSVALRLEPVRHSDFVVKMSVMESSENQHIKQSCSSVNISDSNISKPDVSCLRIILYTIFVISVVCLFLFLGRDYIKLLLLSLEQSNVWSSLMIFSVLFTAVSFPMTWGYILLNIAVGYLYGFLTGIVIVVTCALIGIFIAHHVIQRFLRDSIWKWLANETMRSVVRVVEQGSGLKVIVLARLSPIPFGLQNALFAMADITVQRYMLASFLGMLPSQGLHVYVGSTLRSMEEVISSNGNSSLAYSVFAAQILIAVVLFIFTMRKAREEFNKTLEEMKVKDDLERAEASPNSLSRFLNCGCRHTIADGAAKDRKSSVQIL